MSILKNLFNSNVREIRKLQPLVQAVSSLEPKIERLSDRELAGKTAEFKQRISNGESIDRILPEAFAVVREVSRRVLDMRPFDVQIMGAAVLHQGRIAEMQTGEGKTLVATLPAYLNAVGGRTVHVVTVNDYLARRDRDWMGQIYRFLGLEVGLVIPGMDAAQKKRSYHCPIIYGTNTEFGFDYLRDHMAWRKEDIVQGSLDYAIIDEVDSILIDEARTPLIISGPSEGSTDAYYRYRDLAKVLKRDVHYTVDEKARIVALTEEGDVKAEQWLGLGPGELNAIENMDKRAYIYQALRAKELMHRDIDYVVKDGQVLIVDEFTGRILPGRRFSDGLHQAIEAKEGVEVKEETDTLATITVQNFFRMYKKLAGMTGTAATEEAEFREIYGLDVVSIPTNKPLIRTHYPDSIWKTERAKFKAIVEEISELRAKGRPVLVGTRSIEKSELLSNMLSKRGIPHQVLNAKHHEREAEIVAQAGRFGAVTIATNMAGRGTDILLGGNPDFMARQAMREEGFDPEVIAIASEKVLPDDLRARIEAEDQDEFVLAVKAARKRYQELRKQAEEITSKEHARVVELGGLHVLGSERHESRRIDNQLTGRAGRQGDPGSSRFYLSLEDELMRLFGGDLIASVMERVGFTEDEPIEHPLITKSVETAQKRIEAQNFALRKHVLEYDNVLNKQRQVIYEERTKVLFEEDLTETILAMTDRVIERAVDLYWPKNAKKEEADVGSLVSYFRSLSPEIAVDPETLHSREAAVDAVSTAFRLEYDRKKALLGDQMRDVQRLILIRVIDQHWVNQLRAMDDLREGIGLQAYGGRDPLVEYTRQGFELFQSRIQNIEEDTVRYLFRLAIKQGDSDETVPQRSRQAAGPESGTAGARKVPVSRERTARATGQPVKTAKKVGRNEPCPCGSGKKYKHCCGKLV